VDINKQKEQFSNAYVRAVASVAGCSASIPEVDDDSVDLSLKKKGGFDYQYMSPQIDIQLKCTSQDVINDENIVFPLNVKNYNELHQNSLVPRILVVVIVPDKIDDWLYQTEEQLSIKKCGYWLSLRKMNETENENSVTVYIPRNQQFTVNQLADLMNMVGNGEIR
jgi:hypothetical protein